MNNDGAPPIREEDDKPGAIDPAATPTELAASPETQPPPPIPPATPSVAFSEFDDPFVSNESFDEDLDPYQETLAEETDEEKQTYTLKRIRKQKKGDFIASWPRDPQTGEPSPIDDRGMPGIPGFIDPADSPAEINDRKFWHTQLMKEGREKVKWKALRDSHDSQRWRFLVSWPRDEQTGEPEPLDKPGINKNELRWHAEMQSMKDQIDFLINWPQLLTPPPLDQSAKETQEAAYYLASRDAGKPMSREQYENEQGRELTPAESAWWEELAGHRESSMRRIWNLLNGDADQLNEGTHSERISRIRKFLHEQHIKTLEKRASRDVPAVAPAQNEAESPPATPFSREARENMSLQRRKEDLAGQAVRSLQKAGRSASSEQAIEEKWSPVRVYSGAHSQEELGLYYPINNKGGRNIEVSKFPLKQKLGAWDRIQSWDFRIIAEGARWEREQLAELRLNAVAEKLGRLEHDMGNLSRRLEALLPNLQVLQNRLGDSFDVGALWPIVKAQEKISFRKIGPIEFSMGWPINSESGEPEPIYSDWATEDEVTWHRNLLHAPPLRAAMNFLASWPANDQGEPQPTPPLTAVDLSLEGAISLHYQLLDPRSEHRSAWDELNRFADLTLDDPALRLQQMRQAWWKRNYEQIVMLKKMAVVQLVDLSKQQSELSGDEEALRENLVEAIKLSATGARVRDRRLRAYAFEVDTLKEISAQIKMLIDDANGNPKQEALLRDFEKQFEQLRDDIANRQTKIDEVNEEMDALLSNVETAYEHNEKLPSLGQSFGRKLTELRSINQTYVDAISLYDLIMRKAAPQALTLREREAMDAKLLEIPANSALRELTPGAFLDERLEALKKRQQTFRQLRRNALILDEASVDMEMIAFDREAVNFWENRRQKLQTQLSEALTKRNELEEEKQVRERQPERKPLQEEENIDDKIKALESRIDAWEVELMNLNATLSPSGHDTQSTVEGDSSQQSQPLKPSQQIQENDRQLQMLGRHFHGSKSFSAAYEVRLATQIGILDQLERGVKTIEEIFQPTEMNDLLSSLESVIAKTPVQPDEQAHVLHGNDQQAFIQRKALQYRMEEFQKRMQGYEQKVTHAHTYLQPKNERNEILYDDFVWLLGEVRREREKIAKWLLRIKDLSAKEFDSVSNSFMLVDSKRLQLESDFNILITQDQREEHISTRVKDLRKSQAEYSVRVEQLKDMVGDDLLNKWTSYVPATRRVSRFEELHQMSLDMLMHQQTEAMPRLDLRSSAETLTPIVSEQETWSHEIKNRVQHLERQAALLLAARSQQERFRERIEEWNKQQGQSGSITRVRLDADQRSLRSVNDILIQIEGSGTQQARVLNKAAVKEMYDRVLKNELTEIQQLSNAANQQVSSFKKLPFAMVQSEAATLKAIEAQQGRLNTFYRDLQGEEHQAKLREWHGVVVSECREMLARQQRLQDMEQQCVHADELTTAIQEVKRQLKEFNGVLWRWSSTKYFQQTITSLSKQVQSLEDSRRELTDVQNAPQEERPGLRQQRVNELDQSLPSKLAIVAKQSQQLHYLTKQTNCLRMIEEDLQELGKLQERIGGLKPKSNTSLLLQTELETLMKNQQFRLEQFRETIVQPIVSDQMEEEIRSAVRQNRKLQSEWSDFRKSIGAPMKDLEAQMAQQYKPAERVKRAFKTRFSHLRKITTRNTEIIPAVATPALPKEGIDAYQKLCPETLVPAPDFDRNDKAHVLTGRLLQYTDDHLFMAIAPEHTPKALQEKPKEQTWDIKVIDRKDRSGVRKDMLDRALQDSAKHDVRIAVSAAHSKIAPVSKKSGKKSKNEGKGRG